MYRLFHPMIFLLRNGQVGNQLFQYIGLKKNFPKEKLIFFHTEELKNIFDNINVTFISKKKNKTYYSILSV